MNRRPRCDFKTLGAHLLAQDTETGSQELRLRNEYLAAKNRILRGQIKGRLLLSEENRRPRPGLSAGMGWLSVLRGLFEGGPESLISLEAFGRMPG